MVYLQEASVELAVRLFDETELELGMGGGVMRVKKAEFGAGNEGGAEGKGKAKEEGAPKPRPPKDPKQAELDKQKAGRRAEKLKQWVLPFCRSLLLILARQETHRLVVG